MLSVFALISPQVFSFHSAHPTGWAESISGNGVCVDVDVCHHFEGGHYFCLWASQTPITIHILKAYDESYSKINKRTQIQRQRQWQRQRQRQRQRHRQSDSKTQHMLYFWNPDDLLIPNMMIDTSPWSSCSRQSPWLPCSGHTISSTGPSVSPFRDFLVTILPQNTSFMWSWTVMTSECLKIQRLQSRNSQLCKSRQV